MFLERYDRVFTFFPIPRFLEIRAMGLDISDNAVRVMDLAKTPTGFIPRVYGERFVRNTDITLNREEIIKAILSLKKELDLNFVRVSLPEDQAYLYKTEIPNVSPNEMTEAVSFTIEENAPVSLNEVVFDYKVIGGEQKQRGSEIDVSVSVLPKTVVDTYISMLEEAGLAPISFEIEAQAIARAIVPQNNMEFSVVVHVEQTKTVVIIMSGGAVQFTTSLPVGEGAFINIIKDDLKVDMEKALQIKCEKDFINSTESANINRVFIETLTLLKDEINKHHIYWLTHNGESLKKVENNSTIYLSGKATCIPGFLDFMKAHLNGNVVTGNVWQNCFNQDEYIPTLHRTEAFSYAPAIGLILPK